MMEKREMLLAGGFSSYERTANAGTVEPAEVSPAEPVVYWGKLMHRTAPWKRVEPVPSPSRSQMYRIFWRTPIPPLSLLLPQPPVPQRPQLQRVAGAAVEEAVPAEELCSPPSVWHGKAQPARQLVMKREKQKRNRSLPKRMFPHRGAILILMMSMPMPRCASLQPVL